MPTTRHDSCLIWTTPRSGSTLLCGLLAATHQAGCPASHFHDPSLDGSMESHGLSLSGFASERDALTAVFAAVPVQGPGNRAMLGLRMQRASFEVLSRA